MTDDRQAHWERVYRTTAPAEASWHQPDPEPSVRHLRDAGLGPSSRVIDIGGGDSRLVDRLLAEGVQHVSVLDISAAALDRARARLGKAAEQVAWIRADIARDDWRVPPVDVWHDRAVFHFLTEDDDRRSYVAHLLGTLRPGGHAVIATFAADGPTRCSGLPVERYSAERLAGALGPGMRLLASDVEDHRTPGGGTQRFQWCTFERVRT